MPDQEVGNILSRFYGPSVSSPNPGSGAHAFSGQSQAGAHYPSLSTNSGSPANQPPPQHPGASFQPHPISRRQLQAQSPQVSYTPPPHLRDNAGPPSPPTKQLPEPQESFASHQKSAKRSRQRPTKSCDQCRRKKLKCSREIPCSNCLKGGRDGADCSFQNDPTMEDGHQPKRTRFLAPEVTVYNSPYQKGGDPGGGDKGLHTNVGGATGTRYLNDERQPLSTMGALGTERPPPNPGWRASKGQPQPYVQQQYRSASASSGAWEQQFRQQQDTSTSTWEPSRHWTTTTLGVIEAKGPKSRYVGQGNKMAMLEHFKDCKHFIKTSFKNPKQSDGMYRELWAFQQALQSKSARDRPDSSPEINSRNELVKAMFQALPGAFLVGILQAKYLSNFEQTFRVLHIKVFMEECEVVLAARDAGHTAHSSQIGNHVLPQLLAVISIAARLEDSNDKSDTRETVSSEQTQQHIILVQKWLDGLHGKQLINLHVLRTRTLLLIAKQVNMTNAYILWNDSGVLVRYAMTMGLHRDPEDCAGMTILDKEMRRKIWMTIVELDIQFSSAIGMPTSISVGLFSQNDLLNIDDEDLQGDMLQYPQAKEPTIWTNALPQIALGMSLKHRLNVTNTLGENVNVERDASVIISYAHALENSLRTLPEQFRSSTIAGRKNNKKMYRLFINIMIDVSIRRPLLALYRTVAFSSQALRYPEARKGALACSLAMLAHLDALDPDVADLNVVKSRDYLNLFHIICKNDIQQAVLFLCDEIQSYNNLSSATSSAPNSGSPSQSNLDPQIVDSSYELLISSSKHSLTRVVESTLSSLINRIGEFGCDLKDILPLAVVLQSIRVDSSPEEKKELMAKGAERVLHACRKKMPGVQDSILQAIVPRQRSDNPLSQHNVSQSATSDKRTEIISSPDSDSQREANCESSSLDATLNYNTLDPGREIDFNNFDFNFMDWDFEPLL